MVTQSDVEDFTYLPLSLCLETAGGVATPLVKRGTPLPSKRSETFSTASDNQSEVEVVLCIGERALSRDNVRIGTFRLEGIPAAPRGEPKITVTFTVDRKCAVRAVASVAGCKVRADQTFPVPLRLSPDAVAKMIAEADSQRSSDEAALRRAEARNRGGALIAKAEASLASQPNLKLSEAVANLGLALSSDDETAIRQKSDALHTLLSEPVVFPDFFNAQAFASIFGPPTPNRVARPAQATKPGPAATVADPYIHPDRIAQLKASTTTQWDLKKLVALCEELNIAGKNNLVFAVGMLVRAILDHVPPILGCRTFGEVANNYGGARSFRDAMAHLENMSRKIADSFLHVQIRRSEVLPTRTQVDFRNALDMLLQEVVRILK